MRPDLKRMSRRVSWSDVWLYYWRRWPHGLRLLPFACWDRGFESRLGHGYVSLVCVLWCQLEVSAVTWSHVQRSLTECDVIVKSRQCGSHDPLGAVAPRKKNIRRCQFPRLYRISDRWMNEYCTIDRMVRKWEIRSTQIKICPIANLSITMQLLT